MFKTLWFYVYKEQQILALLIQGQGILAKMMFDNRSVIDYLLANQRGVCVVTTSYMWIKNTSQIANLTKSLKH